jgi:hypothetical protein
MGNAVETSATGGDEPPPEPALVGLGGWLVLVVVGQFVSMLSVLYTIVQELGLYRTLPPQIHAALHIEIGLYALLMALLIWTTVTMFRKKRSFPAWWKITGVFAVLTPIVVAALVSALFSIQFWQMYSGRQASQTILAVFTVIVWWLYLNLSVRVRNTFVR